MTDKEIIDGLYEIKNWKCNGDSKMHSIIRGAIDLLERSQWIPVSERLPKDGQKVLVTTRSDIDIDTSIYYHASAFWKHYVIAWMPLPDEYKESEDE